MTANKIVKKEGKWFVYSEDGEKKLGGPYDSEEEAKERLRQIEYFKHHQVPVEGGEEALIPVEVVANFCPSCAEKMKSLGWKGIKLSWLKEQALQPQSALVENAGKGMPIEAIQGLCDAIGTEPGFHTACMNFDFGTFEEKITDKAGFCAWLHKVCGYGPAGKGHSEKPTTHRFESVTVNLLPKPERKMLEGREHLVVPVVMLTEGVHAGSRGPLFYPAEELAKSPSVWDHKPIVVYHPTEGGLPISACDPDVLNVRKVGVILGTKFDGRLRAEAWLDVNRLRAVDGRILEAVEQGKPVEVSTGLYTEDEETEGDWNGKRYRAIARNYRPDHLAILPDQKGACSVMDGCGLLQNQLGSEGALRALLNRALRLVENEIGHSELARRLGSLLSKPSPSTPSSGFFVHDVFDDFFVYSDGVSYWKQSYVMDGDEPVLKGERVEVEAEVRWKEIKSNGSVQSVGKRKENRMDRRIEVNALIEDEKSPWFEDDRDFLEGLEDRYFKKLVAIQNQAKKPDDLSPEEEARWEEMNEEERDEWLTKRKKQEESESTATTMAASTVEEYIANAPEGMRDVLASAYRMHNLEKDRLIKVILANKRNTFDSRTLATKDLQELQAIAALAAPPAKPAVSYVGVGDVQDLGQVANEEPLVAPTLA